MTSTFLSLTEIAIDLNPTRPMPVRLLHLGTRKMLHTWLISSIQSGNSRGTRSNFFSQESGLGSFNTAEYRDNPSYGVRTYCIKSKKFVSSSLPELTPLATCALGLGLAYIKLDRFGIANLVRERADQQLDNFQDSNQAEFGEAEGREVAQRVAMASEVQYRTWCASI